MQGFGNFNSFAPTSQSQRPTGQSPANFSSFSFPASFQQMSQPLPLNPALSNLKLDTNLESQSIPKPKLKAQLNNNERGYYSSLLSQADPVNSNSVQGKEAVTFFKRSGLGIDVLKRIWVLASANNESLDREEFYVALKLIAFAQNNIEVSAESLARNPQTPLPKFASLAQERKEERIEEPQAHSMTEPGELVVPNEGMRPQKVPSQTIMGMARGPMTSGTNPGSLNPATNNSGGLEGAKRLTETDCRISLDKLQKYEVCFKGVDSQGTGFVGGNEAKEIFLKSGLPTQQLFEIWKLVDTRKEGRLSKGEFIAALHLIMLARQGFQLPTELPGPLMELFGESQPQKPMMNIPERPPENKPTKGGMDLMEMTDFKPEDKCKIPLKSLSCHDFA